MEDILERFRASTEEPYHTIENWKEQSGKEVIGCLPMHIPEELVHAAGLLPVVVPESHDPITLGDAWIQPYFCAPGRGFVNSAIKGRFDVFDGLIVPAICHTIRGIGGMLPRHVNPDFFIEVYMVQNLSYATSTPYMLKELVRLKSRLETFVGHEISNASLRESIDLYNQNRARMRDLYQLRRSRPDLISARNMADIALCGMVMPKETHTDWVSQLIEELTKQQPSKDDKVPLLISGNLCGCPDGGLLDLIEEVGAVIVDDDLFTGSRYYASDVSTEGDPLEALNRRYLEMKAPCPTRHDRRNPWGDYLLQMVQNSCARGVISLRVKFCEPHAIFIPQINDHLQRAGIAHLVIETEHLMALAPLRTRIEAFIETIRGVSA